jgi:hypothetical protein
MATWQEKQPQKVQNPWYNVISSCLSSQKAQGYFILHPSLINSARLLAFLQDYVLIHP